MGSIASLLNGNCLPTQPKPKCIFIGGMKSDGTPTRERFDGVFDRIVEPVTSRLGMDAEKALAEGPCMVLNTIFKKIRESEVVVAEMSSQNTSVGYELGFAHSIARPTVLLIEDGYTMPFDLGPMNRISYDLNSASLIKEAKDELKKYFLHFDKHKWLSHDNPIIHSAFVDRGVSKIHEETYDLINKLQTFQSASNPLRDLVMMQASLGHLLTSKPPGKL